MTYDRRQCLAAALAGTLWAAAGRFASASPAQPPARVAADATALRDRAKQLLRSTLIIDMQCNVTSRHVISGGPNDPPSVWRRTAAWNRDPSAIDPRQLEPYQASGVHVFHCSPELNTYYPELQPFERAQRYLAGWTRAFEAWPALFTRVEHARQLSGDPGAPGLGILLGIEGGDHFRSVDDVAALHAMGLRTSQLTYNRDGPLGGGCFGSSGLTPLGRTVVRAMNRAGIAINVAHANDRTALAAIDASDRPVLVSHGNCRALTPGFMRNVSDDVIRAVAGSGGVVGLAMLQQFLVLDRVATVDDYRRHIDHVIGIAGIEHVGIGSASPLWAVDGIDDAAVRAHFSKPEQAGYAWRGRVQVQGLDDPQRLLTLVEALLRSGLPNEQVRQICGLNFARALRANSSAGA